MPSQKVFVYLAELPDRGDFISLSPKERDEEVKCTRGELIKRQKYFAWKLLEYALNNAYGLTMEECAPYKNDLGKWCSRKCEFSISHSKRAIAVAISDKPVGIDVEWLCLRHSDRLFEKVITKEEKLYFDTLSESDKIHFFINEWTKREAAYKLAPSADNSILTIDVQSVNFFTDSKVIAGDNYIYSIATESEADISFSFLVNEYIP